ncbi:glycosyl transferase, group 1 [Paludibacter propionicigenes WB4]|uniref:Glycosyl transferase, group 1 n=1 Tax=Paludibacter propionicigenes (strain DSM 17365 / JCM 13257 / WB4) TaxID=694427 RepID=E4T426_PALPW|nr:glycosyltransferase [Paludibacter propionicigenes]ADQ79470.1 glycosyl transferase, group 1 [Paludibacter propionicigenes WB4]
MKKVLIVTYYWFPSGGAGVQRWLKFTKYLRDFGWEPIIYTPENPEFPSIDKSFEKDLPEGLTVIKTPIWEPYNVYRKLTSKGKNEPINAAFISENKKQGWKEKLSIWIRGNFLIPDPRRFWIKPSVKYLTGYLKENPVDAIITTGPPHSMHLIGLGVKKNLPDLPWIADFRDPWTNIDFYKELNLTWLADKIHRRLEKKVVRRADSMATVSEGWMKEFEQMRPKRIQVISNGYDESDVKQVAVQLDEKFSISHIGTLNAARNPQTVWKVLSKICADQPEFRADLQIQLVGKVDFSVLESIREYNLQENLKKIDYLSHSEAIAKQQSSQLLLLLINQSPNANGILTGKFYEYLASKRPILAIGPTDGDAARVLNDTGAGIMVGFSDEVATEKAILDYYARYKSNTLVVQTESVEKFSRRSLTGELALLLNSL